MRMENEQGKKNGKRRSLRARLVLGTTTLAAAAVLVFCASFQGVVPQQPADSSNQQQESIAADQQSDSSADNASFAGNDSDAVDDVASESSVSRYSELPADAYAPETVLVMIDGMEEAQATSQHLSELDYVSDASLNASDVNAGFIKVSLAGDVNPGVVADRLIAQGMTAQPNFLYYALDDEIEDEGDDAQDADASILDSAESEAKQELEETPDTETAAHEGADANAPLEVASANDAEAEGPEGGLTAQASGDASTPNVNDPDAISGKQWALTSIGAFAAWDLKKTEKAVTVAVVDSGCTINHEDLKDNIVGTYDTKDGSTNVADEQDHGTPVAGIIAAKANNSVGIAGVSYNAGLYIVRALHKANNDFTADSTDIIRAYDNIIANKSKHNICVVNMSLGSKRTGGMSEADTAVIRKIDEAYATHGILTVAAAGNAGGTALPYACYPCDFSDSILGVINLQQTSATGTVRHSDSNYNLPGARTKDLGAPGTQIWTTSSNGRYAMKSGTSMATPCVAGIAALVFAANPSLTAAQVSSVICSSATDLHTAGFDEYTGYGNVNARAAVEIAQKGAVITGGDSLSKGATLRMSCSAATSWQSDRPSVATVDSSGLVTGLKGGCATISASGAGGIVKKTITVYEGSISGSASVSAGKTASYSVTSTPMGSWSFTSSDAAVASITKAGQLTAKKTGTVTITAMLDSNADVKITKMVTITTSASDSSSSTPAAIMFRLYNPHSGEHLYTADVNERDTLRGIGWRYEGEGWKAPESSSTPVYRLYNPNSGDHHYTLDRNEYDTLAAIGWRQEGVGWYSDDARAVPLYRVFNPYATVGTHHYTTDRNEYGTLPAHGWVQEGVAWYGMG